MTTRAHSFGASYRSRKPELIMESFKTSFELRAGDGRRVGHVGISNETRLPAFVRDVARAVSANEEVMRGMNLTKRELAADARELARALLHVALVWRSSEAEGGERKKLVIDESTVFSQLLSRHHPKSSDSRAHFVVTKRLSKRERKRAARSGTKRQNDGANGSKTSDGGGASASEGAKKHIPRPISTSVSAHATQSERAATTSAPSAFGPLSSQQNRRSSSHQKKEHKDTSKDASKATKDKSTPPSSASSQSDVAKFLSTKVCDPVVFPAFRRSVHGAIGDPFPVTSHHDTHFTTPRAVTSPSRGGGRSARGSRARAP